MFVTGSSQASNASAAYQVANSLRFQSASGQSLNRTPAVSGNRQTWTLSVWVKRGTLGSQNVIYGANSSDLAFMGFYGDNTFYYDVQPDFGTRYRRTTAAVFRDPSAWYHVVFVADTTNATNTERLKVYINNVQYAFSTDSTGTGYVPQNTQLNWNQNTQNRLGGNVSSGSNYFDGYMSDINFVDGQALTPSSFGETNPYSGQWVAKKYTGTYGTNGYYLKFNDGTSTTTLGYDSSGNSNNWTLTNFTRSAGVSDCWMNDVPSGNGGVAGTQPNSNYATLNPLNGAGARMANGNLNITNTNTGGEFHKSTIMLPTTGKYYFEAVSTSFSATFTIVGWFGVFTGNDVFTGYLSRTTVGSGAWYADNVVQSNINFGALNDVWGIAVDAGTKTVSIYLNNVLKGSVSYTSSEVFFGYGTYNTGTGFANFGQRSFAYTPPSGFKALCTANLPASSIVKGNQYMDATLYSGSAGAVTVTNAAGFQPDMVWMKARSGGVTNHAIQDSVRPAGYAIYPNLNIAEADNSSLFTGITSTGFTLTGNNATYSGNGYTYVGWQWQAGKGIESTNTDGTLSSVVSVNRAAGFSIVTWTGTGANATVGHGLGVAPKIIFVKKRSGTQAWSAWSITLAGTEYLVLNTSAAKATLATMWNSTIPTSSVISLGTDGNVNESSATYVAYCFSEIAGFSKIGSYTGNNSADGPFIYLGFRPKFIMIKRSDAVSDWFMYDSSRSPYNAGNATLAADATFAESSFASTNYFDFLSNGMKVRQDNSSGYNNASGGTYIYMAFAENPFANANAR